MSALDDLRAARALIADPKYWTVGAAARDAEGEVVDSDSSEAVCWCAIGAIIHATPTLALPGLCFLQEAAAQLYFINVADVNDDIGHDAVLSMYACAIELAEAQS